MTDNPDDLRQQLADARTEIARLEHALANADLLAALIQVHTDPPDPPEPPPWLSPRDREVLDRLMEGDSVAEAALVLFVTESTVKTHIGHIYYRLGVHNRAGMAVAAARFGLITQPTEEETP